MANVPFTLFRNNIRVKNDLGAVTRVNPGKRVEALMKFRRRFAETPAVCFLTIT